LILFWFWTQTYTLRRNPILAKQFWKLSQITRLVRCSDFFITISIIGPNLRDQKIERSKVTSHLWIKSKFLIVFVWTMIFLLRWKRDEVYKQRWNEMKNIKYVNFSTSISKLDGINQNWFKAKMLDPRDAYKMILL
jgi:hypothetical protein